uniref:Uncharacterized protein n=1 Tax=Chromera velia CCMP2878 TaxID=1169474 RepID=A0A0G4F1R1_9ALVE|mmetsp:Transcript_52870/g.103387  ORF Transcript_52870/g.103387 Transcript_52870/m.103387 type:complete len:110 (-) Transcript_52870:7-336(-)|eukprot:Cvel_14614.t1-p1 / transcript=Cvel_14614.t1 / gene=Cvel_14614 / organism=Chromera_velia_CCMP2878 / gene_product=hypothetical protein / transcript_product=hypothetical protein / location=Cvel_scaffold1045:21700-23621(-) / protein_length=109 / sequence_SO=supercontig / SO=protein_coding / is_pseudo=false
MVLYPLHYPETRKLYLRIGSGLQVRTNKGFKAWKMESPGKALEFARMSRRFYPTTMSAVIHRAQFGGRGKYINMVEGGELRLLDQERKILERYLGVPLKRPKPVERRRI